MTARIDRLQLGLVAALAPLVPAGRVKWQHGEPPLSGLQPFISLSLVSGPMAWDQDHARGSVLLPATSIIVTVTAATVGVRNVIRLNGFDYYRDTVALDTVTTVRDALLALVQAGEAGFVTATASGVDGILLSGTFLGGLRELQLFGELSSGSLVPSGQAIIETRGTVQCLVGVQTYAKDKTPRGGALALAHAVQGRLQRVGVSEELSRYGVAVWHKGSVNDLSAVAGAHWETRATVDLTIAMQSVEVEPVDTIQDASVQLVVTL